MNKKIKILGKICSLLAVVYVLKNIFLLELNWEIFLIPTNYYLIVFSIGLQTFLVLCSGIPWTGLILSITKRKKQFGNIMNIFIKANIMKYVPGNFLHYIGRNQVAIEYDLKHSEVIMVTIIDTFVGLAVGCIFSLLCWRKMVWNLIDKRRTLLIVCSTIAVFLLIVVFYKKNNRRFTLFKFRINNSAWKAMSIGIIYYIVQNAITIVIVSIVSLVCIYENDFMNGIKIGSGYIFSSIVGALTPGAPAGMGVREYIMLILYDDLLEEELSMLVIIMRMISIAGDFLAYIVTQILSSVVHIRKVYNEKRSK